MKPMQSSSSRYDPVTPAKDPRDLSHLITEQSIGYQVRYAYRAFVKTLAEELRDFGVTTSQWSALRVLWQSDGLSQVQLAEQMMVEKASLTQLIRAMNASGIIRRVKNSGDRRLVNIFLTPKGRRLQQDLIPLVHKINERATRQMSKNDVKQLRALLTRLTLNLQSRD